MRKILCIVLTFVICSLSIFSYVHAEENTTENVNNTQNTNTTNNQATDLQAKQQELQNQINEATGELEGVQEELSENLQQVQKLDERIETSQAELDELNIQIAELQTSIDEISAKLEKEEETYSNQKNLLDKRLVAMYEEGETSYLDVILSSSSLAEFLSNYAYLSEIAKYENELLADIQSRKKEIELEKEKLSNNQEQLATIKANQTKTARILENTKTVRENFIAKLSDEEKNIQAQIDEYNRQFAEVNAEILALAMEGLDTQYIGGVFAWPTPGYTRITSKYGMRTHPITGVYKLHTGVDIGAPMGASFVAANDGVVVKAGYNGAYGNMVIIDHGGGIQTLYAHGSEIMVNVGDVVKKGETVVLKVGSTGYSTGAHAHFEVRINGKTVDPLPYITNGVVPSNDTTDTEGDTQDVAESNTIQ